LVNASAPRFHWNRHTHILFEFVPDAYQLSSTGPVPDRIVRCRYPPRSEASL
jgi:hypothetical protein